MNRLRRRISEVVAYAFFLHTSILAASAQAVQLHGNCEHSPLLADGVVPDAVLRAPIALRRGVGNAHEGLTSSSSQAQAYYDQGLSFLYSYDWIHAARSFREALRLDPDLAMAYLGLSYVYSGLADTARAQQMAESAKRMTIKITPPEHVRIDLRLQQLQATRDYAAGHLSRAFIVALDDALTTDPQNINLLLMRGIASEGYSTAVGQRGGQESIRYYKQVLVIDPDNAAAHHFLIHSNEMVGNTREAVMHGEAYQKLAPAIAHAHHMYGHDLRRTERVREAIAQFEKANELAEKDYRAEPETLLYDWNYRHNLNLLGATYAQAGMLNAASRTLKRLAALKSITLADDLYRAQYAAFLLREKNLKQAIDATGSLKNSQFTTGRVLGHMLTGSAFARTGDAKLAQEELQLAENELVKLAPEWRAQLSMRMEILEAQIELLQGNQQHAIFRLRNLILQIRSLPGSDAWSDYVFHLEFIAEVSADAGEWDLTRSVAQELEAKAPFYRGTHTLLSRVAQHDGNLAAASQEMELSRKFTLQ